MNIILKNLISEKVRIFVNNIKMKNPKIIYSDKESLLKIKRYILKYLQNFDIILINIKTAEAVISGTKS